MIDLEIEIEAQAWPDALPDVTTLVRTALMAAARDVGEAGEGAYVVLLADDAAIAELNARFRAKGGATNVLSFPAAPSAAPHRGDIALAFETCAREADDQGKALEDHLQHLVVHGTLHLLGFDHMSEAEAEDMEARERAVLHTLGVSDPYARALRADPEPRS